MRVDAHPGTTNVVGWGEEKHHDIHYTNRPTVWTYSNQSIMRQLCVARYFWVTLFQMCYRIGIVKMEIGEFSNFNNNIFTRGRSYKLHVHRNHLAVFQRCGYPAQWARWQWLMIMRWCVAGHAGQMPDMLSLVSGQGEVGEGDAEERRPVLESGHSF